ncbi:MAG: DUF2807 domain-containing protein [Microscillaceae bacterium]|nr:DUF2807 domain-containing protein [Microscillaceae bacterium]MDW8461514.1 DUF2807 domain-containing protein [Cytophagales bacterium]
MQKRFIYSLAFLGLIFSLSSCSRCLKSTGEIVEQIRFTTDFQELEVWNNVHLHLDNSLPINQLVVKAGKNLINQIETSVNNNKLIIRNQNRCHWLRSFEVRVEVRLNPQNVKNILYQSNGTLKSLQQITIKKLSLKVVLPAIVELNVKADTLQLAYQNSSPIQISGEAKYLNIYADGIGLADAQHCLAQYGKVVHTNINEVRIAATEKLEVTITHKGTVAYYRKPKELVARVSPRGRLEARF